MALSNWDPVMLTMYLNELYSEDPKPTPISENRRRSVVDTIVVDLRQSPDEQDDRRQRRHREDGRPEAIDIYAVNH